MPQPSLFQLAAVPLHAMCLIVPLLVDAWAPTIKRERAATKRLPLVCIMVRFGGGLELGLQDWGVCRPSGVPEWVYECKM